jgi:hypothetical protein
MTPDRTTPEAAPEASIDERSYAAFYRDLPTLLQKHCGQWVAYHGDDCVGFGPSQTELFHTCLQRGLKEDEVVVLFADHAALADHEKIDLPWNP